MTKYTLLLTALAVAAAMLFVLVGGAQAHRSSTVLHLNVTGTKISGVDVPPLITSKKSPETPGDEVIARSKISGSSSGHRYLICAVARQGATIATALYSCQVTYVLARGSITASGVVRLAGHSSAAVTGGTGAYAGAHGVLVSAPMADTITLG